MPMPAVERLVNLTIALLEARRPLTFEEIRRRTRYYPQPEHAAARRMFERDKEFLRALGVPIRTEQAYGMEEPGYRIDRREYELRDLRFEADEVAALAVAVELVAPDQLALALAKVSARAPDPAPLPLPPARLPLDVTATDAVARAVLERRRVRFPYRTADGREEERTVEPYGAVRRRRAWYLVGRDVDRDGLRGFRLDRMTGPLRTLDPSGAFEVPPDLDLGAVVAGPDPQQVTVVLDVAPAGIRDVLRRGGVDVGPGADGTRRLRVHGVDRTRDLAWLLAVAPDAAVVAPAEVRADVEAALQRIVAAHAGPVGGA
jgi:proteasome accessory factor B